MPGCRKRVLEGAGRLRQGVGRELDRRRQAQAQLPSDVRANVALGTVEGPAGVPELPLIAIGGVEDRGVLEVAGDADVRDGHELQAGILQSVCHQRRDYLMDALGDSVGAWIGHLALLFGGWA